MATPSSPRSPQLQSQTDSSFLSNILTPGSSLHPTFLLILDGAFLSLLCVFLGLLVLTRGSIHIFALIAIEGCLWASIKWFVAELKRTALQQGNAVEEQKKDE